MNTTQCYKNFKDDVIGYELACDRDNLKHEVIFALTNKNKRLDINYVVLETQKAIKM